MSSKIPSTPHAIEAEQAFLDLLLWNQHPGIRFLIKF
ncbi:MAG: hypothetical protein Ct9H90mP18_10460 [Gammaproteobacteria bacterium]|nr:MAG: hypothetical protein Ct9H90mP18_10460 [Gammaproteobacteria bacterium]